MIDDIGRPGRPMADYVRVIRRGWWIVLTTLVLVTAVTYFISSRQSPVFQATADDLITTLDLNSPSSQHTSSGSAQQYVATMAQVAQSEQVASAALAKVPEITDMTPGKLLKASTVTADPTATIVEFKVSYHTKKGAVALTNAYAQAFAEYRKQQTTASRNKLVARAQDLARSYHSLADKAYQKYNDDKDAGVPAATVQNDFKNYNELSGKASRADENVINIETQADATLGQIQVQNKASGAAQLAPNTKRNTAIGVILGLVIGIGLVFAREAFDTRIRSAEQVAAELGLPLFGRLPRPPTSPSRWRHPARTSSWLTLTCARPTSTGSSASPAAPG